MLLCRRITYASYLASVLLLLSRGPAPTTAPTPLSVQPASPEGGLHGQRLDVPSEKIIYAVFGQKVPPPEKAGIRPGRPTWHDVPLCGAKINQKSRLGDRP